MDDVMGLTMDMLNSLVIAMVAAMVVGTELYGSDGTVLLKPSLLLLQVLLPLLLLLLL